MTRSTAGQHIHPAVAKPHSFEDMDKGGVATSMTSITLPQVGSIGKDVAVRVAGESNEYAKKMMADHPNRFGVWAMLPLPHIDESLKEIAHALDTLKLDGMGWLARHPRRTFHFTPNSASWLNAVEGFLAKLTKRRLKRGVFTVVDLQAAINRFVAEHNVEPKPFTWTANPDNNWRGLGIAS